MVHTSNKHDKRKNKLKIHEREIQMKRKSTLRRNKAKRFKWQEKQKSLSGLKPQ